MWWFRSFSPPTRRARSRGKSAAGWIDTAVTVPHRSDTQKFLQSPNTPSMNGANGASLVGMHAVADVDRGRVESDTRGVSDERISTQHVVTIDPRKEKTGAHSEPAIEGGALAPVGLAYPVREPRRIFLDDIHGPVGAAAVQDEVLEIGIPLQQDRSQRRFQELRLVEQRESQC